MCDVTGRVALVTGASRGLGRADALALARAGADVVVTDILMETDPSLDATALSAMSPLAQAATAQGWVYAEQTASEIRAMGRRSLALKMDVTDRDQVREVVAAAVAEFGRIDILINNAATLDHLGQLENQADQMWDRDLRVNLTGAFNCSKAVWPHMKANGWGRIIMMSSVAGTLGGFGQASYSTSKAGLLGLARSLALEGGRYNITVNAIVPGIVATEAFNVNSPDYNDRMIRRTVLRRPGQPEDVANSIVFLCSESARYITGTTLEVAGGLPLFVF